MSSQNKNTLFGIPKLPTRALIFLIPFFLSLVMSGIVSLISTVKALGLNSEMLAPWLSSWMLSWIIAFPTVLVVLPLAKRFSLFLLRVK